MKKILLGAMILLAAAGMTATAQAQTAPAPVAQTKATAQTKQAQPERAAEFPGGEKAMYEFIAKNLVYPESAMENGIEGKVIVEFVITADGSVANPKIVRKIDPDLEDAAIKVIMKMPKWKPALLGGKPVASTTRASVSFKM